jgi:hypothetical protein
MKPHTFLSALLALGFSAGGHAKMPTEVDGLIEVKSKKMQAVYLQPGADFRPYTRIMIDPSVVSFRKNWLQNQNNSQPMGAADRRISAADAQNILNAAQQAFDEVFSATLVKAGYAIVTAPGPGVLRLSPSVANLYIVNPQPNGPTMGRTFTVQPSEATLVLEARDSQTNTKLAVVLDEQETQSAGGAEFSSQSGNLADFKKMVDFWAATSANGLENLKAVSPVPADLSPDQKL